MDVAAFLERLGEQRFFRGQVVDVREIARAGARVCRFA